MHRECRERFPRHRFQRKLLVSDPGMHHGTCVTHVPWCMSRIADLRWRGKCSRHSRRMRNLQFYVSGKRPIGPTGNNHNHTHLINWVLFQYKFQYKFLFRYKFTSVKCPILQTNFKQHKPEMNIFIWTYESSQTICHEEIATETAAWVDSQDHMTSLWSFNLPWDTDTGGAPSDCHLSSGEYLEISQYTKCRQRMRWFSFNKHGFWVSKLDKLVLENQLVH